MTYKTTFISVIMITVAILAIWTTLLSFPPTVNKIKLPIPSTPDAFMEEVVSVILDQNGNPKLKLVTPRMVHYPENDTTKLLSPRLTIYRESPQPWFVSAKHGKATEGIENVTFWDNVYIRHPADEMNPETIIRTTHLLVHPNKQTAETDAAILFLQPNMTIRAKGMQADMHTGNIQLLSEMRGEYVPQ